MNTSNSSNGTHPSIISADRGSSSAGPLTANAEGSARPSPSVASSDSDVTRAYVDRLARARDRHGNRLPSSAIYHDPYPDARTVEGTGLEPLLREISADRPARAAWLRHFYEDRLIPAICRFARVRDEAEAELERYNARATALNQKIDAEQERLHSEADAAADPQRQKLEARIEGLQQLQQDAAAKVAAIGRPYDPDVPNERDILHVEPVSLAELAGKSNVPLPELDQKDLLPDWLVWLFTAAIGTMMGLSFGIIGGFLDPDELSRQWVVVFGLSVLGFGPAAFSRKAVLLFHRQAAERSYRGLSTSQRWSFLAGALAFDLGILAIDVLLEREGLLKLGRMSAGINGLSGEAAGPTETPAVWYVVPLAITLGYIAYAAWEGYLKGRRGLVLNRLIASQLEAHRAATADHLARPETQAAVRGVVAVKMALRDIAEGKRQVDALQQPFLDRIAKLEAGRLPILDALTLEQCARIQDALDNLLGADLWFLADLQVELNLLEPNRFTQQRWQWPWRRRRVPSRRAR